MSEKENKEIMKMKEDFDAVGTDISKASAWVDKTFAPDVILHAIGRGDLNFEQAKQLYTEIFTAFAPVFNIQHIVTEGDMVAYNGDWSGKHQGTYMGIPATGKIIKVDMCIMGKVSEGKFIEGWTYQDTLGLMKQLGVMPNPTPAK